eukprot:303479-Chlamydomonas_euryale.AAC.1
MDVGSHGMCACQMHERATTYGSCKFGEARWAGNVGKPEGRHAPRVLATWWEGTWTGTCPRMTWARTRAQQHTRARWLPTHLNCGFLVLCKCLCGVHQHSGGGCVRVECLRRSRAGAGAGQGVEGTTAGECRAGRRGMTAGERRAGQGVEGMTAGERRAGQG